MRGAHLPVMLEEVMAILQPRDDAIYVVGTFGGGGYSEALLSRARCKVFGIDRDAAAIARGRVLAQKFDGRLTLIHGRFSEMDALLDAQGVAKADGVALDLGVSSFQFDEGERGFSFRSDGPLDMRMAGTADDEPSARDLVNELPEGELADLLYRYGDERRSRRIAAAIVRRRPIETTDELAGIIVSAVGRRPGGPHPARRSFQALRIAVNRELEELTASLPHAAGLLDPGGRVVVISYHSLEDGVVKRSFRDDDRLQVLTLSDANAMSKDQAAR